jgi:glycosyltransferase involved in cell wall biosynthesis
MSVYNEKESWIKEAIESILNQTYKNLEFIIVIDNPIREDIIKVIKEYVKKDNRINYFINEKNMGLVYSLNRALKHCNGEYIARMDADDISHVNRFELQLNYLEENNLDLIGCNVNLFNEEGIFYTTNKLLTHKYIKKLLTYGTIGIVHPTFFGREEVFRKLNGYKNAFHAEDMEFLARIFCNDFRVVCFYTSKKHLIL